MDPKPLKLYFDYKSPFAYLAKEMRQRERQRTKTR